VVTAHFVHLDANHALLNGLGLVLMWALFARDYSPLRWLAIYLVSSLAISLGCTYSIRRSSGTWVLPGHCMAS
jgi:membrane associated rhomboid family serine protease